MLHGLRAYRGQYMQDSAGTLLMDSVTRQDALQNPDSKLMRCDLGGMMLPYLQHLRISATGTSDVDHARVAVTTTATAAKEKCLPVLQANQDVFSYSPIIVRYGIYGRG